MTKPDFFHILCTSTPEELNKFISSKGKKKIVNAITFIKKDDDSKTKEGADLNGNSEERTSRFWTRKVY